jgi:hypothetical protein
VLQRPVVVVGAEEERDHLERLGAHARARDDEVGGLLVLDLEHRPDAGLVAQVAVLGDHTVEAAAAELPKPPPRDGAILGRRGEEERRPGAAHHALEALAPLGERALAEIVGADRDRVERHEHGRRLGRERPHARRGRVQAAHQRGEVEPAVDDREQLPIERPALGPQGAERRDDLGEVTRQGTVAAAAQLDGSSVAARQATEAVPLGLVDVVALGQLAHEAREHRLRGR